MEAGCVEGEVWSLIIVESSMRRRTGREAKTRASDELSSSISGVSPQSIPKEKRMEGTENKEIKMEE